MAGENGAFDGSAITAASSPEAKALDGSYAGFQPKPAVEIIIIAMKPLSEKTYVDQALKNGKGVTWLDACRVPTDAPYNIGNYQSHGPEGCTSLRDGSHSGDVREGRMESAGRFPANLLVSDDVLNDGRDRVGSHSQKFEGKAGSVFGCSANNIGSVVGHGDSGSYSRFFSLDAWAKTFPWLIVAKPSKSEKNKGLDSFPDNFDSRIGDGIGEAPSVDGKRKRPQKNVHSTVKPLTLMSYLITLGSRPGDVVLDPFMGSGTTCIAAKMLGRTYIGMEMDEGYIKIAEARLAAHEAPAAPIPTMLTAPPPTVLTAVAIPPVARASRNRKP